MGIQSINEPGSGHTWSVTPQSINEPPDYSAMVDPPVIELITPDHCAIGEGDFTLFVTGTGFYPGSVINFAEHDEPTTLNEDGTLSTVVKPSLWTSAVKVFVYVRNGEVHSNFVPFIFGEAGGAEEDEYKSMHPRRKAKHK
jgi:hypothetical protein